MAKENLFNIIFYGALALASLVGGLSILFLDEGALNSNVSLSSPIVTCDSRYAGGGKYSGIAVFLVITDKDTKEVYELPANITKSSKRCNFLKKKLMGNSVVNIIASDKHIKQLTIGTELLVSVNESVKENNILRYLISFVMVNFSIIIYFVFWGQNNPTFKKYFVPTLVFFPIILITLFLRDIWY